MFSMSSGHEVIVLCGELGLALKISGTSNVRPAALGFDCFDGDCATYASASASIERIGLGVFSGDSTLRSKTGDGSLLPSSSKLEFVPETVSGSLNIIIPVAYQALVSSRAGHLYCRGSSRGRMKVRI